MGHARFVLLLVGLCVAMGVTGCRPPKPPMQVVREFHIALLQDDQAALDRTMDAEGVTTPATDMRLLRDLMLYFVRTHPVKDPKVTPKFVDAVCNFAVDEKSLEREEVEVFAVVNFSQLLVPFLGSAARGVTGVPKDIVRYSVFLRKVGKQYKVVRVELPYEQISDIGSRFEIDTTKLGKTPEELAREAEAEKKKAEDEKAKADAAAK